MKTCPRCSMSQNVTEFHSKQAICRRCKSEVDKGKRRNGNPIREVTLAARARKRRWARINGCPIKMNARRAVRAAIQSGLLVRPQLCSACSASATRRDGATAIQAHHHEGYDKPLSVIWLCPKCHRKHDAARKEAK